MSQRVVLDVDPWDESVLADPVHLHARIREAAPVVWIPKREVWMTGRDDLVREILVDPTRFTSACGVGLPDICADGAWQRPSVILEVDPPEHATTRRVLNRILSPSAMRRLRASFQATAEELVDELLDRVEVDAVTDLAFRFPFTVLPDAVGIQVAGREHLTTYSRMYFDNRAPDTRLARESTQRATEAGSLDWVREQCGRERIEPGGFGEEIYAAADAGEIDEETAASLIRTFLGGGIDTTVLVLGTMLRELGRSPSQWALLRTDPGLARSAFDEALRLGPAAAIVARTTTAAAGSLGGVELGVGRKLVCSIVAANRDPRRWERPDEFDLTRNSAKQLGFGLGPHFCVGHATARLEAECLIGALADRVERIELVGEPVAEVNNWLYGPRSLPVRLHPA